MSVEQWQPLTSRLAGDGPVWREGVPAALERPLRDWVRLTAGAPLAARGTAGRVLLRLNLIRPERWGRPDGDVAVDPDGLDMGYLAYGTAVDSLIDVIDAVLDVMTPFIPAFESMTKGRRVELAQLLDDGLSVYRVRRDGHGLERRADVMAAAALDEVVAAAGSRAGAGSAGAHLRRAWDVLHALRPDPVRAYSEAVKAVESAGHAVVEPNNVKATLGTMVGQLRANPDRFVLAIPGPDGKGSVAPLVENMRLLWEGQTSRHGSQVQTRDERPEEAEIAVSVAVLLVGWFVSGKVRRAA